MKKKSFVLSIAFVFMVLVTLQAQVSKTVNITTAGTLKTKLTTTELSTVTNLTITGNINYEDFLTMRYDMSSLRVVDIGSVTIKEASHYIANTIPQSAFEQKPLTSIILPNSLTSIDFYAFRSCAGLSSITIPNTVTSIGSSAFSSCTGLTSITLPNSHISIGRAAFGGCSGVEIINISENIKSLPAYLFSNCTRVREINSKAAFPPSIDATTFDNVSRNIPVYPPLASREDYIFDPYWSEFFRIYAKDYVNNVVYLNKQIVSIMTVGSGYILKQPIKSGESVSYLIQPDTNFKIASLTVNGKNMLDSLDANGYLNFKYINENKTIVITPKNINAGNLVSESNDSNIRSWCADGNLFVESNSEMNQVELFDINCRIIEIKQNNAFAYVINQPNRAVNVIRVRLLNGMFKSIKVISN